MRAFRRSMVFALGDVTRDVSLDSTHSGIQMLNPRSELRVRPPYVRRSVVVALLCTVGACTGTTKRAGDTTLARADTATRADSLGAMSSAAAPSLEQKKVLDELGALGGQPIESLTPVEARKQPSPADAVKRILEKSETSVAPEAVGRVADRTINGPGGDIPVRIYTPRGTGPFPVIVYFHGGGFVIATMDTYDASARALANAANAVVLSVEYRKGPEHKFPAAHDDAFAAYAWAVRNASQIGGDSTRLALVGESAGGNLALATAMRVRDTSGIRAPLSIVAVYPVAGNDTTNASYTRNAQAKPLSRAMMGWFFKHYTRTPADASDPRLNILGANLKGLPPVTIISAEIDPLLTEGEQLSAKLRDAGGTVNQRTWPGAAHEFFGQGAVVPAAKEAVQYAADALKAGFKK